MKIYTRTGDGGETGLMGGARVSKHDPRVEAYGTVDETNAALGLARSLGPPVAVESALERLQAHLFQLGAELACTPSRQPPSGMSLLGDEDVAWVERVIDENQAHVEPLRSFILPTGIPAAAALHVARTVCRRAERRVTALAADEAVRRVVVVYLNRLADLLFVLARRCNAEAEVADAPWKPPGVTGR